MHNSHFALHETERAPPLSAWNNPGFRHPLLRLAPTPKPVRPRRPGRSTSAVKPVVPASAPTPATPTPLVTPELHGLALGLTTEGDFLRAVADSMTEPFYAWSVGGLLLMANHGWEQATGIPRATALGKSCSAIFPTLMARRFLEVNRLVIEQGQPVREEEFVDKSTGRVLYLTLKFPIRDRSGRIVAVGGISLSQPA